ncbi:MAG TPA: hypothetical protein VF622_02305 [Segetibacter sp.]
MKSSLFILFVTLIFSSTSAYSQAMGATYKNALGVKVWDGAGITFKSFGASKNAVELIGYFYRNGARITGLYEIHGDISGAPGLKWYVGPGAHVGFYSSRYGGGTFAGIDGVLGLDLKINRVPINLSIDWQPSFEFGETRGFIGSWGGVGVRYAF